MPRVVPETNPGMRRLKEKETACLSVKAFVESQMRLISKQIEALQDEYNAILGVREEGSNPVKTEVKIKEEINMQPMELQPSNTLQSMVLGKFSVPDPEIEEEDEDEDEDEEEDDNL